MDITAAVVLNRQSRVSLTGRWKLVSRNDFIPPRLNTDGQTDRLGERLDRNRTTHMDHIASQPIRLNSAQLAMLVTGHPTEWPATVEHPSTPPSNQITVTHASCKMPLPPATVSPPREIQVLILFYYFPIYNIQLLLTRALSSQSLLWVLYVV